MPPQIDYGFPKPPPVPGIPHYPGIQTPGYTPNYTDILANDPGYAATQNNNTFGLSQAAAQRDALLAKLRYRFSGAGNRFATTAQLDRQLKQTVMLGTKHNAGAGMLHSGEQPWMKQQAQYAHDLGLYDASNSVEDQMTNALMSYLGVAQDAASSNAGAVSDAASRLAADPLYQPSSGFAQYDSDLSSHSGKQVYKDMSGRYWTLDDSGNTIPYTA